MSAASLHTVIPAQAGIQFYKYFLILSVIFSSACTQDEPNISYSNPVEQELQTENQEIIKPEAIPDRKPYFGDLHVHTAYSLDSYINFNPVGPREAYRFAQGEEVILSGGRKLKLKQALDFVAVTEHGEYLGELSLCLDKETAQYDKTLCREIRNEEKQLDLISHIFKKLIIRDVLSSDPQREKDLCSTDNKDCLDRAHTIWQELIELADEYNHAGEFTTFIAYEWTGNTNGNNLHRNIIYRNQHVPSLPVSYFEANTPEKLWQQLQDGCLAPCELVSIPHNSNQSNGQQFPSTGITVKQAKLRSKLEPLVEIIQAKGESECHAGFGTADEFCDFEKLERRPVCAGSEDKTTSIVEWLPKFFQFARNNSAECASLCDSQGRPDGCVWANNYIRNTLKDGLRLEEQMGINPYKFGVVGSTDTHNGTPGATDESNYMGHHGVEDGSPEIREALPEIKVFTPNRMKGSGGLAGVWAEENTRDSIFAALKRKETFGTSGTRIVLRFFGGWEYPELSDEKNDFVELGYKYGVPMGGDLPHANSSQSPNFLFWAMKGNDGANLQRIQIIKGWYEKGETMEQTYDVACSDGSIPDETSYRCPDNGAFVDVKNCEVSADKGAIELKGRWQDPKFNSDQRAFYYMRVLENPGCRWSTYEAIREGKQPFDDLDPLIQERAWSSAIWYTPEYD